MAWKFSDVLPKIPRTVGGLAVTFFKESWRRQGWLDKSLQKWLPCRHPSPSDAGKAILVQRGHLRNSIRILSSDSQSVAVGSTLPYAEPHNDGGRGSVTVRRHTSYRQLYFSLRRQTPWRVIATGTMSPFRSKCIFSTNTSRLKAGVSALARRW